jgi:branched-chain amino acid transport system substrate-binding protein
LSALRGDNRAARIYDDGVKGALLISLALVACARRPETKLEPLRIGVITGLTGPTAAWGEPTRNGAMLAVEKINAGGGIAGRPVELITEDDQGKPEQSAVVATKLIARDKVIALVCCDSSSRSLAAAPIAQSNHIPMITPTSSLPAVTRVGDYIFRVCPTDDFEARVLARVASERLHARRVAILRDAKNDYSVGVAAVFTEALRALGSEVALVRDYNEGDSDLRSQLVAVREAKADALLIPGYYGDVAQAAIQARDLGLNIPMIGGSAWNSPALAEIGGSSIEGALFVSPTKPEAEYEHDFQQRFGKAPEAPTALTYDAVMLIAAAAAKAPGDQKATRDAIAATRQFHGASGTFDMTADRNPRKPLGLYEVRGGKFVEVGRVEP